jgi:hypothetical protein
MTARDPDGLDESEALLPPLNAASRLGQ